MPFQKNTFLLSLAVLGITIAAASAVDAAEVADSQPDTRAEAIAKKLITDANELRVQEKYAQALVLYQRAYAVAPSPRTEAQLGLGEGSAGHWVDSDKHLTDALKTRGVPWIEKNRRILEAALNLERSHIGLIQVTGPDDAEVLIEGNKVGRLPLKDPIHVAEGRVVVEGRASGRESASTTVNVIGGQELTLRLDLPLESRPVAALSVVPPVVGSPVRDVSSPKVDIPPPVEHSSSWKTPLGIGIVLASVGLATLGITWIVIDGDQNSCSSSRMVCSFYETRGKGWVATGVAAAAAVGGGTLLFLDRSHTPGHLGISFGPRVNAALVGQF